MMIGLMILSLISQNWVYAKLGRNISLEGGLTGYNKPKNDDYSNSKDDTCNSYDMLKEEYKELQDNRIVSDTIKLLVNLENSKCKMFSGLMVGGKVFIGLEIVAVVALLVWIIANAVYCFKGKFIFIAYVSSCFGLVSHSVGLASFMALTNTFYGSCDEFPIYGSTPRLCASFGPSLALAVLIVLALETFMFFIVACLVQKTCGNSGLLKELKISDDTQNVEEVNETKSQGINDSVREKDNDEVIKKTGRGQVTERY
jgi:hypothetical protein